MPLITHALLFAGYALVALTTGLALARVGEAGGAEAVLGGVGLFCALAVTHAGLAAAGASGALRATEKRLKADIDKLRAGQREGAAELDALADRIDKLDMALAEVAHRRIEPPPQAEFKLIDQIVEKLGRAMESRFDEIKRVAGPGVAAKGRSIIDTVREALEENRVDLHLQPIVTLPQRRTAFYEGFSRLKDETGRALMPAEFIPAAEKAGLMSWIDNMLLFRCVQLVRKFHEKDRRIGIFCNISSKALSDEAFFPQFYEFLREHREMAGAVIFEIPQAAFLSRSSVEARAMARLADLGFRFSIDKVTRLDVDLVDMERAGVRFFKVPAALLHQLLVEDGVRPRSNITREIAAADVAAVFIRYSIDIIAERIEEEPQALKALELEVPYGQGHLFGAPRPIKDSLMEETAPPKGYFADRRGVG